MKYKIENLEYPGGPFHDFVLMNKKKMNYDNLSLSTDFKRKVQIDDDFCMYLNDSLRLLNTLNPAFRPPQKVKGLNYTGITVINGKAVDNFSKFIRAYLHIFEMFPKMVELTGQWQSIIDKPTIGKYTQLKYRKKKLMKALKELLKYTEICQKNSSRYILHLGI